MSEEKPDIVERLREIENLKTGDSMPKWLPQMNWGPAMSAMAKEAADEIERLRSIAGKADVGQSFAELTSEIPHQMPQKPIETKGLTADDVIAHPDWRA